MEFDISRFFAYTAVDLLNLNLVARYIAKFSIYCIVLV
eukprot:SAG31_NODE_42971_length_269_cov_0.611765_1_plen_37_part_01